MAKTTTANRPKTRLSPRAAYTPMGGAPNVTGVNPSAGPTTGGTSVTISGSNFTGATGVTFGGTPASFSVVSDGQITATTPPHAAGAVAVCVTNTSGTSCGGTFTYQAQVPVVTSVSPSSGPTTGGTPVTISGSNFTGATSVTFGGTPASFTVVSGSQINATPPPHAAGPVQVCVSNGSGMSTQCGTFTYQVQVPVVTSVSPTGGPTAGGTSVTISGSNFTGATGVTFGGTPASFSVVSDSQINATTPPHSAGPVQVCVSNGSGTSAQCGTFTYQGTMWMRSAMADTTAEIDEDDEAGDDVGDEPSVKDVEPATGRAGTRVKIHGSGFDGVIGVGFGSLPADGFAVLADTEIDAAAPSQPAGLVEVRVATIYGVSAPGEFTYTSR